MIYLYPLQQLPLEAVRDFVFNNEIFGVALAERLEQYTHYLNGKASSDDKGKNPGEWIGDFFCLLEDQVLWGVIFVSKPGLVLTCVPQNLPDKVFKEAIPVIANNFRQRKVYCVSGWSRGTQLVTAALQEKIGGKESSFSRQIIEHRQYLFMCYDSRRCQGNFPQYPVVQCNTEDLDALYHLQSAYDTVEVLPKNHSFKPELCRTNLQRLLQSGTLVAIPSSTCDGSGENRQFMAKANVSALSWRFMLIGGVYTSDKFRRRGCAARLVQWLGDFAAKNQKQAVLFVRQENLAARHSYENAGFFFSGSYEIVYY